MGSKYRAEDIERGVLEAADLVVDYGQSKYANSLGCSSTIIDFADFSVIRVGVMFDQLKAALDRHCGIRLKTADGRSSHDPGVTPMGFRDWACCPGPVCRNTAYRL
jgi:hypothetical protein